MCLWPEWKGQWKEKANGARDTDREEKGLMELEVGLGHRWKLWFLEGWTLVCAAKSARSHTTLDLE